MSGSFPDELQFANIGTVDGSIQLRILRRFRYISPLGTIEVQPGFISDGASVPRPLWPFVSPFDMLGPPVVHDWLYSPFNHEYSRAECDYIFYEGMKEFGVPFLKRRAIYYAVRACGWLYFKGSPRGIL